MRLELRFFNPQNSQHSFQWTRTIEAACMAEGHKPLNSGFDRKSQEARKRPVYGDFCIVLPD
jgi:hypothetical protein